MEKPAISKTIDKERRLSKGVRMHIRRLKQAKRRESIPVVLKKKK